MKDRPCEITQHSKKDPLTIKCEVLLSPLLSNIAPKSITLKITASPEDWKVLYSEDPQYLGNLIWLYFANQAMKKISPNIHKEQDVWLNKVKAYVGCVYTWASYWFKKPSDERPDTFKSEFDLSLVNDGQTDYLNMDRITADHMERIFGEGRKRYGLAEWIADNDATTATVSALTGGTPRFRYGIFQ